MTGPRVLADEALAPLPPELLQNGAFDETLLMEMVDAMAQGGAAGPMSPNAQVAPNPPTDDNRGPSVTMPTPAHGATDGVPTSEIPRTPTLPPMPPGSSPSGSAGDCTVLPSGIA